MLKTQLLSLDLQRFADPDPQPNGSETKTYTKEEIMAECEEYRIIAETQMGEGKEGS